MQPCAQCAFHYHTLTATSSRALRFSVVHSIDARHGIMLLPPKEWNYILFWTEQAPYVHDCPRDTEPAARLQLQCRPAINGSASLCAALPGACICMHVVCTRASACVLGRTRSMPWSRPACVPARLCCQGGLAEAGGATLLFSACERWAAGPVLRPSLNPANRLRPPPLPAAGPVLRPSP